MNDSKTMLIVYCGYIGEIFFIRYISQSIGLIALLVNNLLLDDSKKDYFVLYLQILSKFEVITKLKKIFLEKLQLDNEKNKRLYQ